MFHNLGNPDYSKVLYLLLIYIKGLHCPGKQHPCWGVGLVAASFANKLVGCSHLASTSTGAQFAAGVEKGNTKDGAPPGSMQYMLCLI